MAIRHRQNRARNRVFGEKLLYSETGTIDIIPQKGYYWVKIRLRFGKKFQNIRSECIIE